MLIPERVAEQRKRRHWHCIVCGVSLGTIAKHHRGGTVLESSTSLLTVTRIDTASVELLCRDGHATMFRGSVNFVPNAQVITERAA